MPPSGLCAASPSAESHGYSPVPTAAGSGQRAAAMYSLIVTAKMNNVDPQAWLADVLARIAGTQPLGSTNSCRGIGSRGVIVAAIASVFTTRYAANLLDEDEEWLHVLSIDMEPEDGCLHVYGVSPDGVTAFTQYGIECLQQIVADERTAGQAPPQVKPPK